MTKTDILNGLADKVAMFYTNENDTLTSAQQTELTDQLAAYLETVNPNHDYPPVAR